MRVDRLAGDLQPQSVAESYFGRANCAIRNLSQSHKPPGWRTVAYKPHIEIEFRRRLERAAWPLFWLASTSAAFSMPNNLPTCLSKIELVHKDCEGAPPFLLTPCSATPTGRLIRVQELYL
jgi:hypothetical protein